MIIFKMIEDDSIELFPEDTNLNDKVEEEVDSKALVEPMFSKKTLSKICKAKNKKKENIGKKTFNTKPLTVEIELDENDKITNYSDLGISADLNKTLLYTDSFFDYKWEFILDCFYGKKLTNQIFPIIFETSKPIDTTNIQFRSLDFLRLNFLNKEKNEIEKNLSLILEKNAKAFYFGIRDLAFAYSKGLLISLPEIEQILRTLADYIPDDHEYNTQISQLSVSPFPTKNKKLLRLFEPYERSETLRIFNERNFLPHTVMYEGRPTKFFLIGYVDPQDLSFHNYENIINLDQYFTIPISTTKDIDSRELNKNVGVDNSNNQSSFPSIFDEKDSVKIPVINAFQEGLYSFYLKVNDKVKESILNIDNLDLYIPPFNATQRGGKRFIFSSNILSNVLTQSIKDVMTQKVVGEKSQLFTQLENNIRSMSFVNYVFRYNKFSPGDKKFNFHYDTPYYSQNKKQISKYTLIIYLTSGKADSVVKFKINEKSKYFTDKKSNEKGINNIDEKEENKLEEVSINEIDTSQGFYCLLFDHAYEHEGQAFINNDKIFIRSEIVLNYSNNPGEIVRFSSLETKLFNVACYMAKQSLFNKELADYTNDLFNHSTKSKLVMYKKFDKFKLILKNYSGINYLTNGDDYYFPNVYTIKIHSVIALLDYFNCCVDENSINNMLQIKNSLNKNENLNLKEDSDLNGNSTVFNKLVTSRVLNDEETSKLASNEDILDYLNELQKANTKLFDYSSIEVHSIPFPYDFRSAFIVNENQCCPRDVKEFYANGNKRVVNFVNNKIYEENISTLNKSEVCIFGKKVVIDLSNLYVEKDKVSFKKLTIPRVHFAGCDMESPPCWDGRNESEFTYEESIEYQRFTNIPPIYYNQTDKGFHLKLDIFNNNYIITTSDVYKKTFVKGGVAGV